MSSQHEEGRITSHPILEFERGRKITIFYNRKPIVALRTNAYRSHS